MQQGSLIATNESPNIADIACAQQYGIGLPVKGEIYTCSGIGKCIYTGGDTLGIEELCPVITTFRACKFYEVQPPMDVAEFVEECCCVPIEI